MLAPIAADEPDASPLYPPDDEDEGVMGIGGAKVVDTDDVTIMAVAVEGMLVSRESDNCVLVSMFSLAVYMLVSTLTI